MHTYISQHKNCAYFVFLFYYFILFFICMSGRICMPYKYHSISFSFILRRSRARGETIQTSINIVFANQLHTRQPDSSYHLNTRARRRKQYQHVPIPLLMLCGEYTRVVFAIFVAVCIQS